MRSPTPGQSPDGEKVSDSTPLLQGAPQAEAGEPRSDPGLRAGGRSELRWPESQRPRSGRRCFGRGAGGVRESQAHAPGP